MKNELFKNEAISLMAIENENYVDYIINEAEGQPQKGVLLPYRLHGGHVEYLIKKTLVEGWDAHSDICALQFVTAGDLVSEALALTEALGYKGAKTDIYLLGVIAEGMHSNRVIHLSAVQLTRFVKQEAVKSLNGDEILWIKKDDLLTSVDSRLHSAYARLMEYL
jgi:hypothetical protein